MHTYIHCLSLLTPVRQIFAIVRRRIITAALMLCISGVGSSQKCVTSPHGGTFSLNHQNLAHFNVPASTADQICQKPRPKLGLLASSCTELGHSSIMQQLLILFIWSQQTKWLVSCFDLFCPWSKSGWFIGTFGIWKMYNKSVQISSGWQKWFKFGRHMKNSKLIKICGNDWDVFSTDDLLSNLY